MRTHNIDNKTDNEISKEFWDSLHAEIIKTNKEFSQEDIFSYVEKSFMYSLFFRGTSHKELSILRNLLDFNDLGYLILLEFFPKENTTIMDFDIDELSLYYFIKEELKGFSTAIGPMIYNRLSILVTDGPDTLAPNIDNKISSINIATNLLKSLENKFQISLISGIGNVQSIHSIYTSYMEALSCMQYCNPSETIHIQDIDKYEKQHIYEYKEAEKLMIDAVRLKKSEAYDYFVLMMDRIKHLNVNTKRNKIIEALVLASHASKTDDTDDIDCFDYTRNIDTLVELRDYQLIEWAFQKFVDITGYVKKHNSIDYSNKIVQATKEYLEAHYAEEISLEDVAEHVNISPQYFSKLIKKNTGFNFIEWLSMLRIKKAKELLVNPNLTVKEVCFMVGYKDPNYFSRIFKKKIGMTPSEYIKKSHFN